MNTIKEIATIILILAGFAYVMCRICEKGKKIREVESNLIKNNIYKVTAYCPCEKCCGRYADGITASGIKAEGKIISAPKNIPFGTLIFVPGYGWAEVLDRGGSITERKLDVFFSTHEEAMKWGVKYLKIEIF